MEWVPLPSGYFVQHQNCWPAFLPVLAVRRDIWAAHWGQTGGGELFAVAATFYEGFFQGGDIALDEEVCLMEEADERVA
jgi:hypothetical protein